MIGVSQYEVAFLVKHFLSPLPPFSSFGAGATEELIPASYRHADTK